MQKWEYMTVRLDHGQNQVIGVGTPQTGISSWLDGRGSAGWELISAVSCSDYSDQVRLYFKRLLGGDADKD